MSLVDEIPSYLFFVEHACNVEENCNRKVLISSDEMTSSSWLGTLLTVLKDKNFTYALSTFFRNGTQLSGKE